MSIAGFGWVPEVLFCGDQVTNKKQHCCCVLIRIWKNGGPKLRKKTTMQWDWIYSCFRDIIYLYTVIGVETCLIFYSMFDIQCILVYRYAIYLGFTLTPLTVNKMVCLYFYHPGGAP